MQQAIVKNCTGEAHDNEMNYDHCGVCMPGWGKIYLCPKDNKRLINKGYCRECKKHYEKGN